jgi:hypothetical protein
MIRIPGEPGILTIGPKMPLKSSAEREMQ